MDRGRNEDKLARDWLLLKLGDGCVRLTRLLCLFFQYTANFQLIKYFKNILVGLFVFLNLNEAHFIFHHQE